MINMTLESLLQFLRNRHYESDIQTDTQQVYTIYKLNKREYPLFFRLFDEGHLLQLLVFIPCALGNGEESLVTTPEKTVILGDLARFLHLLNKELDVPGFGMDEGAGVVFYRLMLPTPKKKIEEDLLLAYLKTIEHVCEMFSAPIEAVSSGQMTLDQIIEKAKEMDTP